MSGAPESMRRRNFSLAPSPAEIEAPLDHFEKTIRLFRFASLTLIKAKEHKASDNIHCKNKISN
ncbi:MAG: hypothetical protein ABSC22_03155 [Roseiarcus sp.]|jgi:hypothetical protein